MALRTMQKLTASGLLLYLCGFIWAIMPSHVDAQAATKTDIQVLEVKNLQKLGTLMSEKKLPLLLAISAEHCPYCQQLDRDFLRPMLLSGEYKDQVIIRRLSIDSDNEVVDFLGNKLKSSKFANRYQAYLTPTMIFLDAQGKEVADKIIGITTPQLFGAYIDIEISKALKSVRQ